MSSSSSFFFFPPAREGVFLARCWVLDKPGVDNQNPERLFLIGEIRTLRQRPRLPGHAPEQSRRRRVRVLQGSWGGEGDEQAEPGSGKPPWISRGTPTGSTR